MTRRPLKKKKKKKKEEEDEEEEQEEELRKRRRRRRQKIRVQDGDTGTRLSETRLSLERGARWAEIPIKTTLLFHSERPSLSIPVVESKSDRK